MPKINKTAVDALKPDPKREVFLWDSALAGFGVRMQPSGKASFILKYRTTKGDARKMTFGRVGILTPDEARKLAIQAIAKINAGGDPSEDRKTARKAMTVADLADQYVLAMEKHWKKNTQLSNKSQIERHIKPLIGRKRAADLTHTAVEKMQSDITNGKTAAQRKGRGGHTFGGKGAATRALVVLGAILNYGMKIEAVGKNVASGVKKVPVGKRTRFLSVEEIRRLGVALTTDTCCPAGPNAIRFLLLTGWRRNEALTLKREYCHPSGNIAVLPDTKTGHQTRVVPDAVFQILDLPPQGWVFPSERGDGHFVGVVKALQRVTEAAGISGVSPHTLRHTYGAMAASLGYSELTIAGLLGHSSGSVTSLYSHVADSALLSAADEVSNVILRALEGEDVEPLLAARRPKS